MGETQAGNQTKPKVIIKGLPRPVVETHEEFGDMYEPVDSPISTNGFTIEGQLANRQTAIRGAKDGIRDERWIIRWGGRIVLFCLASPVLFGIAFLVYEGIAKQF
jgi:hypothetical protein